VLLVTLLEGGKVDNNRNNKRGNEDKEGGRSFFSLSA